MKYIIRTAENGVRIPHQQIEEKKRAVKERILAIGLNYLEYQAVLGSNDPLGNRIEEQVTIIEDVGGNTYA